MRERAARRVVRPRQPIPRAPRHPTVQALSSAADRQRDAAVRQFNGIVGASTPSSPPRISRTRRRKRCQEIIAQTPGVQLTSLFGGVNGVKTSVDLRGFGAFATANTPRPHQRTATERHRHGAGRSFDHSAQFDRANRDYPRQQRRGALWRQRGRRRHQHRHQDRRRRPAGRDPRRSRRRLVQPAPGERLDRGQFGTVVGIVLWQWIQVRRIPGQQCARPAQRHRQPQLHHARPHGIPDGDRRRPEARDSPAAASSIPRSASTSWSPTAGAPPRHSTTATSRARAPPPASPRRSWNGVDLIVDGGVRNKKRRAGSSAAVAMPYQL